MWKIVMEEGIVFLIVFELDSFQTGSRSLGFSFPQYQQENIEHFNIRR